MPIQVEKDPGWGSSFPLENCCMCGKPTAYWYGTGAKNVALCKECAEKHTEAELPTKAEWIAAERMKNPRPF